MPESGYPQRLSQQGSRHFPADFHNDELLYHGYALIDIDPSDQRHRPRIETIRLPDFSCNWSRYSSPEDVHFRRGGDTGHGCYSFSVSTARLGGLATTVHDPIFENEDDARMAFPEVEAEDLRANIDPDHPNFAHVEIRMLREGESWEQEPPRQRKGKSRKDKDRRSAFRQNLFNHLQIEFPPLS